jgi:ABC-2 type transport system ATP-binding protein
LEIVVRVEGLRKSFGKVEVLRGVDLEVREGEVFGIVGPNGAGKTTLLRVVAGLVRPSAGRVFVLGRRVPDEVEAIRGSISYLPEESNLYGRLTGYENLEFFARIYSRGREVGEVVKLGATLSGLSDEELSRRVETYSKGMVRRVALAATLMVRPRLAILDEPTAGLDVVSARYIREVIRRFARELGTTILMSSHNMFEVGKVCDRVALINSGVIVAQGTVEEVLSLSGAEDLEEAFAKLVLRSPRQPCRQVDSSKHR